MEETFFTRPYRQARAFQRAGKAKAGSQHSIRNTGAHTVPAGKGTKLVEVEAERTLPAESLVALTVTVSLQKRGSKADV